MGGGAFQQATPPKGSMGLIMPLYTLGIIAFFLYTILKVSHLVNTSRQEMIFKDSFPPDRVQEKSGSESIIRGPYH